MTTTSQFRKSQVFCLDCVVSPHHHRHHTGSMFHNIHCFYVYCLQIFSLSLIHVINMPLHIKQVVISFSFFPYSWLIRLSTMTVVSLAGVVVICCKSEQKKTKKKEMKQEKLHVHSSMAKPYLTVTQLLQNFCHQR